MGDVNSKIAPAINDAIFLMLGCIGFMLASFAGFAIYLMKRSSAPLPPHAELAQMTELAEGASDICSISINKALGILPNASEHGYMVDHMLEVCHWFVAVPSSAGQSTSSTPSAVSQVAASQGGL